MILCLLSIFYLLRINFAIKPSDLWIPGSNVTKPSALVLLSSYISILSIIESKALVQRKMICKPFYILNILFLLTVQVLYINVPPGLHIYTLLLVFVFEVLPSPLFIYVHIVFYIWLLSNYPKSRTRQISKK